ncbi:MAG: RHS repeat-associated core domain-containing protein, partial [Candidatus Aenigmatarchaeota archaeon]
MAHQVWDSKVLWILVLATFTIVIVFSAYPVGFFSQTITGKSYVYANGQRVATINAAGTLSYSHNDYLGSARLATSESAEQIMKYDNAPFGSTVTETGYSSALSSYKFTGKEQDSSGLYYYGARYYNPDIGRFVSVDPVYNPAESPYAYAANNPLKYVDPSGEAAINEIRLSSNLRSLYENTVQTVDELREMPINDYVNILCSVLGWDYNEPGGKYIYIAVPNIDSEIQLRYQISYGIDVGDTNYDYA